MKPALDDTASGWGINLVGSPQGNVVTCDNEVTPADHLSNVACAP